METFINRDSDKRAIAIAKQRQLQERTVEKTAEEDAITAKTDMEASKTRQEGSSELSKDTEDLSPAKPQLTEIMYPNLPKAQSLPAQSQTFKERRRVGIRYLNCCDLNILLVNNVSSKVCSHAAH